MKGHKARIAAILFVIWAGFAPIPARAADHAVIFMYHRFGEGNYPSTNITLEQFEQHIRALQKGPYQVWPLPKIVDALQNNRELPDYVVGITIDDAPLSVYHEAWPRLKKAGFPFTIFVTTDDIDRNSPSYMNWDQLRELSKNKLVTIGNHTASHPHMPMLSQQANAQEIIRAQDRFEKELGFAPDLFAYPYGEFSEAVKNTVRNFPFRAAFGQHSGVAAHGNDMIALPRFALNETYGNIDRFLISARALPLPVRDVSPQDSLLNVNQPAIEFTLDDEFRADDLSCFASDQGKVAAKSAGQNRIRITLPEPWGKGRARVNCTLQEPPRDDQPARWRWWGTQFIVP